jgi:SHS2 domain-containing protein
MYETFEHTADLGLRIRAGDLAGLFEEAARALFAVIVANADEVRAVEEREFQLSGQQHDELLRDWLAELLYTFHVDRLVFARFDVRMTGDGLTATARGEPIDPERHAIDVEIKAITYHGLLVEPKEDGWLAEVIVDI